MEHYSPDFYKMRHQQTIYSAKTILSLVIPMLPSIRSGIDIGCGVGTWLSVLKELGVKEIQGIDGDWVDKELLAIPKEHFLIADLTQKIEMNRRFDLAISLEVAEHLPPASARNFIRSLVSLSDFIVFSAAIPFQGGTNHLNEQWPEYWAAIFAENGYMGLDLIRKAIWNDRQIPVWYRQNVLLYIRKERKEDLKNLNQSACFDLPALSVVHPELFVGKNEATQSVRKSWRFFHNSLTHWIQRKFVSER